jgi:hypothetical protein
VSSSSYIVRIGDDMTVAERARYHQLHPAKLVVDWSTAIAAGALLWRQQWLAALVVGFVPSIIITLLFMSGRLDSALERIRSQTAARALASHLTPDVNVLRFGGLALSWAGCVLHQPWLVPVGIMVILGAWLLAWERRR